MEEVNIRKSINKTNTYFILTIDLVFVQLRCILQ